MDRSEMLEKFREKLETNRYAPKSVETYVHCIKPFLSHFDSNEILRLSEIDIENFLNSWSTEKEISKSYQDHTRTAIEKLYFWVFDRQIKLLPIPNAPSKPPLPASLPREDIKDMIKGTPNIKHRCLIGLLYSTGLRVEEIILLRNSSLNFTEKEINLCRTISKTPRTLPLSHYIIPYLETYRKCYANDRYVFESSEEGKPLTSRTIQEIVAKAAERAGIECKVTPTMLRNSFGIHLLQNGMKPKRVKELMGLEADQSMQRYILAANARKRKLRSPLD